MAAEIRLYTKADYPMLSEWWRGWKWPPVIEDWLPPLGAICSCDGKDVFAGFLVQTDISAAIIEWVVSNPAEKQNREECKTMLLDFLCHAAQAKGYSSVFVLTPSQHLIRSCEKMGFTGAGGMTSVVRFF